MQVKFYRTDALFGQGDDFGALVRCVRLPANEALRFEISYPPEAGRFRSPGKLRQFRHHLGRGRPGQVKQQEHVPGRLAEHRSSEDWVALAPHHEDFARALSERRAIGHRLRVRTVLAAAIRGLLGRRIFTVRFVDHGLIWALEGRNGAEQILWRITIRIARQS